MFLTKRETDIVLATSRPFQTTELLHAFPMVEYQTFPKVADVTLQQSTANLYFKRYMHSRLGNQMFILASSLSLAKKANRVLCLDQLPGHRHKNMITPEFFETTGNSDEIFPSCPKDIDWKNPDTVFTFKKEPFGAYNMVSKTLTKQFANEENYEGKHIVIPKKNYVQSFRYFQDSIDVHKLFTFRKEFREDAEAVFERLREEFGIGRVFVGVHIRRGDQLASSKPTVKEPTEEFFLNSFNYFRAKFGGSVLFVLVSDDPEWFNSQAWAKEKDVHALEKNSAQVDMQLLISSDHLITTLGTFGWWGGYLGAGHRENGEVVYWKRQFIAETSHFIEGTNETKSYYFPDDWIAME